MGFNSAHTNLSGLTAGDDHTQYQKEDLLTTQGDIPYATGASTWARLPKGTAGQRLRMNSDATAPAWGTISDNASVVFKTADESVNNSIALQNDDHLFLAMTANEKWEAKIVLYLVDNFTSGDSANFKFAITVPSGAAIQYRTVALTTASAIAQFTAFASGGAISVQALASVSSIYAIHALVQNGGTAGNLQFQWAQATANTYNTTLKAGSCLVAHELI